MISAVVAVLIAATEPPAHRPPPATAVAVTVRVPLRLGPARGSRDDAARDSWFGPDKVKHFFLSAFIESVAYSALRGARVEHGTALAGASATAAAFGVGKELHDWRARREFSVRDLAWDAAGAAAAGVLMSQTIR